MYDVVIIGGGPAGLSAAIYFARQKVQTLVLMGELGGKTLWSADVENYLGFHLLNGVDLVKKFREHLQDYREVLEMHEGEYVSDIERIADGTFTVKTEKHSYQTKTVLVATGEKNRMLNVPGEKEYYGKGVTYCATCDAPLFSGKRVHVIGGGNSAMDAALLLAKYAEHITLVSLNAELAGDAWLKEACATNPRISFVGQTKTSYIAGKQFVESIGLIGPDGKERIEETQGVCIEIGLIPSVDCANILTKDDRNQIIIDRYNRTSVQGIWAAGDVTDVADKQIAIAVGEGSKAALDMIHYLQRHTA